jgi:dTDP-4-amino-4,6-dideoxygalactose transaminase
MALEAFSRLSIAAVHVKHAMGTATHTAAAHLKLDWSALHQLQSVLTAPAAQAMPQRAAELQQQMFAAAQSAAPVPAAL